MKELKPCPFCGGAAVYESTQHRHDIVYNVYCEKCGVEMARLNKQGAGEERDYRKWVFGMEIELARYLWWLWEVWSKERIERLNYSKFILDLRWK